MKTMYCAGYHRTGYIAPHYYLSWFLWIHFLCCYPMMTWFWIIFWSRYLTNSCRGDKDFLQFCMQYFISLFLFHNMEPIGSTIISLCPHPCQNHYNVSNMLWWCVMVSVMTVILLHVMDALQLTSCLLLPRVFDTTIIFCTWCFHVGDMLWCFVGVGGSGCCCVIVLPLHCDH